MWNRVGAQEYFASQALAAVTIVLLDAWWKPEYFSALFGEHGIVKAIVGPFVGASLAFWAARVHDEAKVKKEEVAAARVAVATLSEILNDLAQYRQGLYERIEQAAKVFGEGAPRWAYAFPLNYTFKSDAKLDLPSLDFLFEAGEDSGELYRRLTNAGRCHAHTQAIAAQLFLAAEDMQERIADAAAASDKDLTMADAGAAIGLRIRAKMSDLMSAATDAFRVTDEADIIDAARQLKHLVLDRYPGTSIPGLKLPHNLRFAALPKLPADFLNPKPHA